MINVLDQPDVYGNGILDDWPGLQRLINTGGGAFYFPPGRYRINSTLVFPNKTGYHLMGSGLAERVPESSAARGAESVIVWGAGGGGPMIRYEGEGLVWNALGLWGCNWPGSSSSCPGSPASIGLLIKRPSTTSLLRTGKIWFGSLIVEDCATAIATASDTVSNADEVAFGYFWPKGCTTAVHLQHVDSMNFSFEYVHAEDCGTIFKVANGGRIVTQAIRVLSDGTTLLDVSGGDDKNAFYHINGLALDDGVDGVYLLRNVSTAAQVHHFRFTNAHFVCSDESPCPPSSSSAKSTNCHPVEVLIDRTGSSAGQTVLELVGCRGLAALDSNVLIKGAGSTKKSHLIVRESEITRVGFLIDMATPSSNYSYSGFENWTYGCGIVPDDSGSA
jgi:hypothetical protein